MFSLGDRVKLKPEFFDAIPQYQVGIIEKIDICDCGEQLVGVIWNNFSRFISWYHAKYLLLYTEE